MRNFTTKIRLCSLMLFLSLALFSRAETTAEAPTNGTGAADSPYEIANLANLRWLNETNTVWDKHFIQTADIDATETSTWNGGKGWAKIGVTGNRFTGLYDGQSHTISNLFINRPAEQYLGFLGETENAVIKNIGLVDVNFTADRVIAAVVGYAQGSQIDNVFASGSVTGRQAISGLVAYACVDASITNAYSHVAVSGVDFVAGLTAFVSKTTVRNIYVTGTTTYTTGPGGSIIAKTSLSNTIENCFWDTESSGIESSNYGTGLTTAQMKDPANFTGWDFSNVWYMSSRSNNGYPSLKAFFRQLPKEGMALEFDGVDDVVNTTVQFPIGAAEKSFSAWIKIDEFKRGWIIAGGEDVDNKAFGLLVHSNGGLMFHGNGVASDMDMGVLELDKWYFIAVSYNGTEVKGYVNGSLYSSKQVNLNTTLSNVLLGKRHISATENFSGIIDNVRLYNGAITLDDVQNTMFTEYSDDETGVLAYYDMDFENGTVLPDKANANNGTLNNMSDVAWVEANRAPVISEIADVNIEYVSGQTITMPDFTAVVKENANDDLTVKDDLLISQSIPAGTAISGVEEVEVTAEDEDGNVSAVLKFYIKAIPADLIGEGTEDAPYEIATLVHLRWLSESKSVWGGNYFIQTADIDAADTQNWNNGAGFACIGSTIEDPNGELFKGYYNGQGHVINNLYINRPSARVVGLFASCGNMTLEKLGVTNANVIGGGYVGILVGVNYQASPSIISECYTTGLVSGTYSTGGLIGHNGKTHTINCYSLATVSGNGTYFGGLAGSNYVSGLIENCFAGGIINATGTRKGGLAGLNQNGSQVINSFWDVEVSSQPTGSGGTGLTTAQLQMPARLAEAGWDLLKETDNGSADIWGINPNENGGYPFLAWQGFESVSDLEVPNLPSLDDKEILQAGNIATVALPNYLADLSISDNVSELANLEITQSPAAGTTISGAINEVTITAKDEAGNIAIETFNVAVINKAPVIDPIASDLSVDENSAAGTVLLTVSGKDENYTFNKVTLTANAPSKLNTVKLIREVTGLSLLESKRLSDNVPSVIISSTSVDDAISIKARFEAIGATVSLEEADSAAPLSYSVNNSNVAIDAATGVITISNAAFFNYETNSSISFEVIASDGELEDTKTVTFGINDVNEAPVFDVVANDLSVDENSTIGTELITLSATDVDDNAKLLFSTTSTDVAIDAETGVVTIANARFFDFEINTSISFDVKVSDGELEAMQAITVTINNLNDNAPVFDEVDKDLSVDENSVEGTELVTLKATDADEISELKFSTTSTDVAIDAETGVVTISNAGYFDYETNTTLSFTATVSDGVHRVEETVTIAINDVNDLSTGSDEVEVVSFDAYPNPTQGELNIQLEGNESQAVVYVYNASGVAIYNTSFDGDFINIQLPEINTGIYLLRVDTMEKSYFEKIVVK